MFDDPAQEIQDLTSIVKQDITGLNRAIEDLQQVRSEQRRERRKNPKPSSVFALFLTRTRPSSTPRGGAAEREEQGRELQQANQCALDDGRGQPAHAAQGRDKNLQGCADAEDRESQKQSEQAEDVLVLGLPFRVPRAAAPPQVPAPVLSEPRPGRKQRQHQLWPPCGEGWAKTRRPGPASRRDRPKHAAAALGAHGGHLHEQQGR